MGRWQWKGPSNKELRAVTKFMVHLSNKKVIDYHITKDLFLYLLNDGAEDYVLVAAELFKELDLSFKSHHFMDDGPIKRHFKGVHRYFIKKIHQGQLGDNVKHLIKGLLIKWDAKFQEKPSARSELDWLKPHGIFCHYLFREYSIDEEITRDIFIPDPLFHEREMAYEFFKRDLLLQGYWLPHTYKTKNFLELRRAIESLVWSPLKEDIERIGHELLLKLEPGGEMELCWLILEYCYRDSQADYVLRYSFLAEYLCKVNKLYQENFYKCFFIMWFKVAGLGLAGFRSLAMLFSGLLAKDLLSWHVLAALQVTLQDMAKSSEYFVECLFKELEKKLTMNGLISRLLNPSLQDVFDALLPHDGVRDSKYFVQFFKSIDMGRIPKSMMRHSIGRAVTVDML